METRETLEAALVAAWDRDTLAVYADHLLSEGDPRGELIALDLQIAATGNNLELSKRRTSLVFAWLGALVPVDDVHASWVGDSLKFGFVEDLTFVGTRANAVARLEQAFASPAGPYVRGLTMRGTGEQLAAAFAVIARREHAWLTRLTLWGDHAGPAEGAIVREAFRAMPNLAHLELHPPAALAAFSHRTIERLVVHGRDTYGALGDAAFDAVTELVVELQSQPQYDEFYGEDYVDEAVEPAAQPALPRVAFPALRRLDLGRISPSNIAAMYELLRSLEARTHVTCLRVPQLRSASDREELVAAIRDMDALETIEVAQGSYYDPPDIPGVKLARAERWPWPTQELAHGNGLRIFMPGAKYGDTVTLIDAVYVMEQAYETLPLAARESWSQLWRALPALPATFPARVLADAVDAFPALMENGWRELREELSSRRPLGADAMVKLEHCKL